MKYVFLVLIALPLFAAEPVENEIALQEQLAQGKMIPVVDKNGLKSYKMDPSTNELEDQKLSNVLEDTSDE